MSGCPYVKPSGGGGVPLSPESLRARMTAKSIPVSDGEPPRGTYYSDYLQLDQLLSCQEPLSKSEEGSYVHEELLFITVHQSHELWFKLIISDLSRVHDILTCAVQAQTDPTVFEADLAKAVSSLERVKAIQPMLLQKLAVMETMTPMEFLEFRDFLVPASGFQSYQFRIIEILLGLSTVERANMSHDLMKKKLRKDDYDRMMEWESKPSLQDLTEEWLEHMPWLKVKSVSGPDSGLNSVTAGFNWTKEYKEAVYQVLDTEERMVREVFRLENLSPDLLEEELGQMRSNRATFDSLFDKQQHETLISRGVRTFSQEAILNAIFAYLYRDMSALHTPFRFLTLLVEIDDGFTSWRYRHAQMAHRMIGRKMGTGATSGADHLLRVAQQNSSFKDLRNLSTFLIPTSKMPPLPPAIMSILRHETSVLSTPVSPPTP
jgi:tryptophan 2,3-dioxygenase